LANHALQTGAERRQQMRAGGLCGGAAAQSLAIDRHMARCRRLAKNPTAQGPLQRGDIQILEQFAPHEGAGTRARPMPIAVRVPRFSRRPQRTMPS
jgi:hypothetical protein